MVLKRVCTKHREYITVFPENVISNLRLIRFDNKHAFCPKFTTQETFPRFKCINDELDNRNNEKI